MTARIRKLCTGLARREKILLESLLERIDYIMPHILKINGVYSLPSQVANTSPEKRFDHIFENGVWARSTRGESVSGTGSMLENTQIYRRQLKLFLKSFSEKRNRKVKFFDGACGDLNWVKEYFTDSEMTEVLDYIGGDISGKLIQTLKNKYPNINLFKFNMIEDKFPEADIFHARHVLFHLSLSDIYQTLKNFTSSNIEYALITNHFLPDVVTHDIPTGSFRFLDLTNYPFYLPKPYNWLLDSKPLTDRVPFASGLWDQEQIKIGIKNYEENMK